MADSAAPAPAAASLDERVARQTLALMSSQIAKLPVLSLLTTAFLVWLAAGPGLTGLALLWGVTFAACDFWRWRVVLQLGEQHKADPVRTVRRLHLWQPVLGLIRGWYVPLVFSQPVAEPHYLFTMVFVGLAAGAISTIGGDERTYSLWALAVGAPLALAWALYGGAAGVGIAVLLLGMLLVLRGYVRDTGRMLRQMVLLAHEKEQLAESLRHERDRAESANQSKTRFFAAASHDLRQPLHALSINATTLELVARRGHDPLVKELSQGINRALTQSNSLLDGLLDVSRLDAGAVSVETKAVAVAPLLEALRDEHLALAAQRGLALELDVADVAGVVHAHVASDVDLLTRVLNNLLSNALKFTAGGKVVLSARVVGASDDAPVLIAVADTGPGIAAEEQERVFEEFYQIGNTSRDRTQGLGLGLAIVRRMAVLLGIDVRLDSAPGRGTRVELTLPRAGATQAAAIDPGAALPVALPASLRVLAIDDERDVRVSLAVMLRELGCDARCADGSAEAALLVADGFSPQLLLVDHRLRGETGPQAIELLRRHHGVHAPAVIITGDTAPQTIQQAEASGHLVLHKPVDGQRLLRALAQLTALAAPRSQPVAAAAAAFGAVERNVHRPAA